MMQCPNCGTGNRLGAIFCRSCGTKLEFDEITSETFEKVTGVVPKDKADRRRQIRSIIVNVLRLAFLGVIVYGLYLALQRPEVSRPETKGQLATQFRTMAKEMMMAVDKKRTVTQTTTEVALNSYLASRVAAIETKGRGFRLVDSWVGIEDSGRVEWVIEVKLFGRLMRLQYFGTVKVEDDRVTFTPKGFFAVRMGELPLPTPFMKLWSKRLWRSILDADRNEEFLAAISDLKFEGDDITVTVSP